MWASELLPTDRVSVENGAIVCNCARWPLMIDPQLQGITWIKKKEEKNGVKIARLGQKTLMPQLEAALSGGLPFVIENVAGAASEMRKPYMALKGQYFGLQVERTRLFEPAPLFGASFMRTRMLSRTSRCPSEREFWLHATSLRYAESARQRG